MVPPRQSRHRLSLSCLAGSFCIELFGGGGFGFLASIEDGKVSPSVVHFRVHLIPTGKEPWDKAKAAGLDLLGPAAGASGSTKKQADVTRTWEPCARESCRSREQHLRSHDVQSVGLMQNAG
ncbi:hypothetical protein L1887_42481 [Cichorium endivia]|nr:hypothetical protein L1887_42481 [Cichorium endivia]